MSKSLKKVLKKIVSKDLNEKLAVADAKLGNSIKVRFCTNTPVTLNRKYSKC